jgi:hypothetical protein
MAHNATDQFKWKRQACFLSTIFLFTLCLFLIYQSPMAQDQKSYEQKTELKASSLLTPELLKSDLYTIDHSCLTVNSTMKAVEKQSIVSCQVA